MTEPTRKQSSEYWERTVFDTIDTTKRDLTGVEGTGKFVEATINELMSHVTGINFIRDSTYNWSNVMLLNKTELWKGKKVMDFGCGTGCESHIIARHKPKLVTIADIVETNIMFASRVLSCDGQKHNKILWSSPEDLRNGLREIGEKYDIIYSPGVLHHIPDAKVIVNVLKEFLEPDGIFHIMLYYGSLKKLYYDDLSINEEDKITYTAEGPYSRVYNREEVEELFGEDCRIVVEKPFNESRFCMWVIEKVK